MHYNTIFQRQRLHSNHFLVILRIISLTVSTSIAVVQGHAIDQTSELAQETSTSSDTTAQSMRWLLAKSTGRIVSSSKMQMTEPNSSSKLTAHQLNTKSSNQITQTQTQTTTTTTTTTTTLKPSISLAGSWIESILIDVERIAVNEHEQREKILSQQHPKEITIESNKNKTVPFEDPECCVTTSGFLALAEVPTDSGEDPLESQLTTTTFAIDPGNHTTLYDTTNVNNRTYEVETALVQPIDIESNNVSIAILASMPSEHHEQENENDDDHRAESKHDDDQYSTSAVVTPTWRDRLSCERAYTQCALRRACEPALRAYNDDCQDLIMNKTSKCTSKCLKSMIALRSSEEGDDLANCDCENNDYCFASKQRSQLCRADVERALEPTTVVSCSTATWICAADQLCSTALDYYNRNCQTLFSLRHCSMRCNNSLAILYRQPKASKLINCQCDGSEEFPCHRYRTLTEKLCLNKQQQTAKPTLNGDDGSDNDDETFDSSAQTNAAQGEEDEEADLRLQAATNEDDSLNLTNDPLDMPTVSSHGHNNGATTGNEQTSEDMHASYSNSNINLFNGIQQQQSQQGLAEDNWIPLVSGRYFTNLQHQQQHRRTGYDSSAGDLTRPHKQQSSSGNQQRQTSRNGTRQHKNIKPNEMRSRKHARISMFALTSSVASTPGMHLMITQYCLLVNSLMAGFIFIIPSYIVRS